MQTIRPILSHDLTPLHFDLKRAMVTTAQAGGPGAWRQLVDILALRVKRPRFGPLDYYVYGLYRAGLSKADRAAYVPYGKDRGLHADLTGPAFTDFEANLKDKLWFETRAIAAGLEVAQTVAVFGPQPAPDHIAQRLETIEDLTRFLCAPENLPVFGKPRFGSDAIGVVWIVETDGKDTVVLANGERHSADALAKEILRDWSDGYIFQRVLRSHSALRPHLGRAANATRITTVLGPNGPEILYALQRISAADAMYDGSSGRARGFAGIDPATGLLRRISVRGEPWAASRTHWNDEEKPMLGLTLPHFKAACDLAIRAHQAVGQIAIVGFDVVIEENGPRLMEANANPYAICYQIAWNEGLLTHQNAARLLAAKKICSKA